MIDKDAEQGEFEGANPPTLGEFELRKPRWRKLFRITPLADIETRFTSIDWAGPHHQ
jgi:hypothetical protein